MTETGLPWEKALELASKIKDPITVAAFTLVLASMSFWLALKAKKPRIAWLLAVVLLVVGLAPLASSTYLASRGIYHVRIVVLGEDGQPNSQAIVSSTTGGDLKKDDKNWEFDIPPQSKPSGGKVTFFASLDDAYMSGTSILQLGSEFYPTVSIPLTSKPPVAVIRGVVVDEKGKSVSGASVSIPGYPEIATTNEAGNFLIPSHHADGQLITVRAEKGNASVQMSAIAGKDVELVLRTRL